MWYCNSPVVLNASELTLFENLKKKMGNRSVDLQMKAIKEIISVDQFVKIYDGKTVF